MQELMLFTDGSVDNKSKIGYGAYLTFSELGFSFKSIKMNKVQLKRFEATSSTRLELQTLLWALSEIDLSADKIFIFTDSQNITNLPSRRKHLEENNYSTKKNNLIKNNDLYKEFYKITDKLDYELVKIKGHKRSFQKNDIDWLFTLVDRASRKALRKEKTEIITPSS